MGLFPATLAAFLGYQHTFRRTSCSQHEYVEAKDLVLLLPGVETAAATICSARLKLLLPFAVQDVITFLQLRQIERSPCCVAMRVKLGVQWCWLTTQTISRLMHELVRQLTWMRYVHLGTWGR